MPTAIVTGGAVRLGQAFVLHLAGKGYDIALHYSLSKNQAEETVRSVRKLGRRCHAYSVNFRDLSDSEKLVESVIDDFTDVSLLINNAANFIQENIEQTKTQTLTDTLSVNLMTPFLLMREYKRRVGRGMIVNIIDQRVLKNISAFATYSVAKVGLAHLTQLAAVEWGSSIRVNGIAPGLILPPAWETEEYLKREAPKIPVADHGSTDDLLKGLDYLLEATYVNGEILFIDGGESKSPGNKLYYSD